MGLRADRLTVASLTGTAERLAGTLADDALGVRLGADLDAGEGAALEQAKATIWAVSRDPVLLSVAASHYCDAAVPQKQNAWRLLIACGADPDEARRIKAERGREPGWTLPQAERGWG